MLFWREHLDGSNVFIMNNPEANIRNNNLTHFIWQLDGQSSRISQILIVTVLL